MNEYIQLPLSIIITIGSAVVALVGGALAIQRWFYIERIDRLSDNHKNEIAMLNTQHEATLYNSRRELHETEDAFKKDTEDKLKKEYEEKSLSFITQANVPLKQELKLVYVKYLYIRKESEPPVYTKYVNWLDETIDVNSEYHYYRFNKYNHKNNSVTITDRSTGIVDQNILFPWKELTFTDVPSKKIKGLLSQDIDNSDAYFSVTSYYNGFKENAEDIGVKMEMDTDLARMIVDFSSIVGLQRLFVKEPDAYKIELNGKRVKLLGLERINEGVYHLEHTFMKKGESLLLDFHVNWDFLNDKSVEENN